MNDIIADSKVRNGKFFKYSEMKKENDRVICLLIMSQRLKPMNKAFFHFHWMEKTTRRDPDNIAAGGRKFILDALVHASILENDGWKNVLGWTDYFHHGNSDGVIVKMQNYRIDEG